MRTTAEGLLVRLSRWSVALAWVLGTLLSATASVPVEPLPGRGSDIAVGADGSAFTIGWSEFDEDRPVFKWVNNNWQQIAGEGKRIAVGPQGDPWVVNTEGEIYHWENSQFVRKEGRGTDIAVGANGAVWLVGWYRDILDIDEKPKDRELYSWTGTGWVLRTGEGVRIAVGPDGNPWVVNEDGAVWRLGPVGWSEIGGHAQDVGVGADGTAYITGNGSWIREGTIQVRVNEGWLATEAEGMYISVGPTGQAWFVNDDGDLFRFMQQAPPELRLSPPVIRDGKIEFTFPSRLGATYTVQVRRGLQNSWQTLMLMPGTGGTLTVSDPMPAGVTASFYRVIQN